MSPSTRERVAPALKKKGPFDEIIAPPDGAFNLKSRAAGKLRALVRGGSGRGYRTRLELGRHHQILP